MNAAALLTALLVLPAADLPLDETPAAQSEWGYRPAEGAASEINPPNFSWRPQKGITRWQLTISASAEDDSEAAADKGLDFQDIEFNVFTPPQTLAPGSYRWRYRGFDDRGRNTAWSQARLFQVLDDSVDLPMPSRQELLQRVPDRHPRLFVRPEDVPRLRELAGGSMRAEFQALVAKCDALLKNPPPTAEPPKYPPGTETKSEEWRKIWWGNREYTIRALDGAATLAFTRLLGGSQEYGQLARRILLDCAAWDPKGSTGYRYNDEAGMPYAYHFSRTYTLVNDLLSEEERQRCREVMRIRGDEMYRHLCPRHLWQPYGSHANRAWHFLGEIGIAFLGEIEGADDWLWFAMNVFYNTYPVWSDADGGWHEGTSYWASYISRFTWWADVMRVAVGVDAYRKPFFKRIGYYPMYLMPPGQVGGGFGDLTAPRKASQNRELMTVLAAQSGNPHWQWYVEQLGGPLKSGGYIGFLRGTLPEVQPAAPEGLPTSRLFRGTGQAYLNTRLDDAEQSVQIVFKSSPFGTQSHGYEANNSFQLWAYGQRMLIRSGYRDIYGSDHHRNWMWSTRSVNNITVSGRGQLKHSAASQGRVSFFRTMPALDVVVGEAAEAYRESAAVDHDSRQLDRFTRAIVFAKPDLVIVFDRLVAREPETFQYWLHALNEFEIQSPARIGARAGDVVCPIQFLAPAELEFTQTDQFDPNPRQRIKLREWHLTGSTPSPAKSVEFVTVMRPHRQAESAPEPAKLEKLDGGYVLTAVVDGGTLAALLPTDDQALLEAHGLSSRGAIVIERRGPDGKAIERITVAEE